MSITRMPYPKGMGVSDIFYIYVGSTHFLGVKNFEFNVFGGGGGLQKNKYIWGMNKLRILRGLWVIVEADYLSSLCILGSFLRVKVKNGIIWS